VAAKARATNARKAMLMAAAVASVKLLTTAVLMRFVMGVAADRADINKYATTCKYIYQSLLVPIQSQEVMNGNAFERLEFRFWRLT
jgi:hypothetical protein